MAGLLGDNWDDPRTMATLQLAAGLLSGKNFGQGMGAGVTGYQNTMIAAQEQARRQKLAEAQMAETLAQAEERKAKVAAEQRGMIEQQRLKDLLRRATQPVSGGEAATAGGITPQAAQMVGQEKPIDWRALIAEGVDYKLAEALANAPKLGMPEVARTIDERGPDGQPLTVQFDKFGGRVGAGVRKPVEMKTMGLGGTTKVYNPFTLGSGDIAHTMTPEGKDASARGWAGHNLTKQRFDWEKTKEKEDKNKPPSGYRRKANGDLEAIPGGPADKSVTDLTDAEGKATSWLERMNQAESVITKAPDWAKQSTGSLGGMVGATIGSVPILGDTGLAKLSRNTVESSERQSVRNAEKAWVGALLRSDTGASYKDMEEKDIIRTFFWQPGESLAVKKEKEDMRDVVRRSMVVRSGEGAGRFKDVPALGSGKWTVEVETP